MKYLTQTLSEFTPAPDYRARAVFADGFTAEIDLSPLLAEPIFAPWKDRAFFAAGTLDYGVPYWNDDLDLSPGALRAWCEAGRVMSVAETDRWVEDREEPWQYPQSA